MDTYKTTAKDFKVFTRAVKKWQKKMGLEQWSIYVSHKDDDEDPEGDVAWVVCDYESLVCTISLAVDWPIPPDAHLIDVAAYHECRHLALAPLLALIPDALDTVARQEEHRLMVLDERLLFGKSLSECGVEHNDE